MSMQSAKPQYLLIIFGPPGVGKLSVTSQLTSKYNMKPYHQIMLENLVLQWLSPKDTAYWSLILRLRNEIFQGIAQSYISHFVIPLQWDLEEESDRKYIETIASLFEENQWNIRFVELEASIDRRMKHYHEEQLHKNPEHTLDMTETIILDAEDYVLNTSRSNEPFTLDYPYLKINSTNLNEFEICEIIIDHFHL